MLQQLWPYISEYSANFMREFIEPQVLAQMPAPFKSFRFIDIDMGDAPCRVSGLKVIIDGYSPHSSSRFIPKMLAETS
jgi:hypothetical protein